MVKFCKKKLKQKKKLRKQRKQIEFIIKNRIYN